MKSKLVIDKYSNKCWLLPNGDVHRENGPAIYNKNGLEVWATNNKPHRVNGPAVVYCNGMKEYYLNGVVTYQRKYMQM